MVSVKRGLKVAAFTAFSALLIGLLPSQISHANSPAAGYEWSTSTFIVTPQLLGIANDGSKRAGVDQAAFIDSDGNIRLIFASYDEKKRSVVSLDGGKTWKVDTAFQWATWTIDRGVGAYVAVSPAHEGGYRAFVSFGDKGIVSAYSKTGQMWTADAGVRFKGSDFGLQKVTASNPIKLKDGTYRMYVGDDSDYFRKCASDPTITTKIYSVSSKDQLNWTVDAGTRIDSSIETRCKLHPQAFMEPNGTIGIINHVNIRIGDNDATHDSFCMITKSQDGLNFGTPVRLPIGLTKDWETATPKKRLNCDDASILVMPDGTLRAFFAVFGPPPEGDQIGMSTGTIYVAPTSTPTPMASVTPSPTSISTPTPSPTPVVTATPSPIVIAPTPTKAAAAKKITITCLKGKTIKKVTAVNPKCPAGYKKK